jgi:hypothetical protein
MLLKNNHLVFALAVCTALFTSCYIDKEDLLYGRSNCDTTTVSFSKDVMPIINNRCSTVGCHVQGGSGIGILENHTQIKAMIDKGSFEQRVFVQRDMPTSGPLSDCQIEHLQKWIADGALNN